MSTTNGKTISAAIWILLGSLLIVGCDTGGDGDGGRVLDAIDDGRNTASDRSDADDDDDDSDAGGAGGTFLESGGIVVIEAESTASALGEWRKRTSISGYTGSSHLEFTGNTEVSGPATSPLTYTFKITNAGTYRLILRGGKTPPGGTPHDQANDCYVRMDGDYSAGGDAPKSTLEADTKMFGAKEDSWDQWTQTLDSHASGKDPAQYEFKAGETYTLTISGRSRSYHFDRIVLFDEDSYTLSQAKDSTRVESSTAKLSVPSAVAAAPAGWLARSLACAW